jgi:hypothetical protein
MKGGLSNGNIVMIPAVAPDPVEGGGGGGSEEGGAEPAAQLHPRPLPHVHLLLRGRSTWAPRLLPSS